ncbi:nitroreductase family protein [Nocardioides zeae]|uniref:Nitroreductase family protein n=1 Tax=Nocardioides imazamoxiresistens TaxID=3231893 RepID=A0ABU3PV68_9ACTN|nr:nitroreductase family protein [Nocardioides zeae]MDT9593101.1 nitroreductase family protein [Nocardioides zeae]
MTTTQETLVRAPRPGAELIAEPMRSRWSPAVFDTERPVGSDVLDGLLAAAAWAPSTGNSQPWAYVVVRRGTPAHDVVRDALSRGNSGWVPTAPVVVVAATLVEEWEGRKPMGDFALYDLGQSVAHLTLQAQASGLHTHQFAGFDHDAVARGLGFPPAYRVMTGIAIGYVAGDELVAEADEDLQGRHAKERVRHGVGEVAYAGEFGTPYAG